MLLKNGMWLSKRDDALPGKFGGSPLAEYAYILTLDGGEDEQTGSVEWRYWVARFGKRLLFEDSQGFVTLDKFHTEQEAIDAFREIDNRYSAWADEDGES